jgi:hypothetical protein
LSVPSGLEMGPFSYYPDWDSAAAARHHVLNRAMLRELISTTPASVAAFSGYGLAIRSPAVEELSPDEQVELRRLVLSRYAGTEEIPYFGQDLTTLTILVKRPQ